MLRSRLLVAAAAFPLLLSGCVSLGPKPPKTLISLQASTPVKPGAAHTADDAHAVAVTIPNVQPALATQRVMVQDGPTSVAYIPDAAWAANPGLLFRNLLAETIEGTTGRFVPDQRNTGSQPDTRLSGQLLAFGIDAPARMAVVTFDGVISKTGSGQFRTRRFSAQVPIGKVDGPSAAVAINQAANQVAAEVAAWVG
jgi:cholesterol transport system auxiliary component